MSLKILSFCFAFFICLQGFARPLPKWVSEKGYWQVETNIHTPWNSTIRFFNNDGVLVYQETLGGQFLDLSKKRTLKRLKRLCDRAVTTWQKGRTVRDQDMVVTK